MHTETNPELKNNLIKEIEAELQDKTAVWGHGTTTKEQADSILEEGVLASPLHGLSEIASPLTDSEKSISENANYIVDEALHWPHKNAPFVILVNFPQGITSMLKLKEIIKIKDQERTRIPSRFLRGYIDSLNLTFVRNPKFEKDAHPTDYSFPIVKHGNKPIDDIPKTPIPSQGSGAPDEVW